MSRPYAAFNTQPADLAELGLHPKLTLLVKRLQRANKDRRTRFDWTDLLAEVQVLRCMSPRAAHAVDQTLVREQCLALVGLLLQQGSFSFEPALATRGLAIHSNVVGVDPDLWAFAQRQNTEIALLENHDAFSMLPLEGWSFFGNMAVSEPVRFFEVNHGTTTSEHLVGSPRLTDAEVPIYGRAVAHLFQGLLWCEHHQPDSATVRDKGPGWNLRNPVALQAALLAGWPVHTLAQRWASMVGSTTNAAHNSLLYKVGGTHSWGEALLTAHGQMALARQVAALSDQTRWEAIGTMWRAYGWEKRHLGSLRHAVQHTPALRNLFVRT